ncbi:MAG: hypothetical protein HKN25_09275 [Pyrinomonadaceae bacterium]|nr:hypothetical protein [Pyrinomonadaceae bacterium]
MEPKLSKQPIESVRAISKKAPQNLIPAALIDKWDLNGRIYEFRNDDRYYVYDTFNYLLTNGGNTLEWSGWEFSRLFGDTGDIIGVWEGVDVPGEELNLRGNGTYTWQIEPGSEYFGDFTYDSGNLTATAAEMRATVSTSGSDISFYPPYGLPIDATWSISEPYLTLDFSGTQYVYERV